MGKGFLVMTLFISDDGPVLAVINASKEYNVNLH